MTAIEDYNRRLNELISTIVMRARVPNAHLIVWILTLKFVNFLLCCNTVTVHHYAIIASFSLHQLELSTEMAKRVNHHYHL